VTHSVLFYVQHLLGIGHLRRSLRIAEGLAREGIEVTLVSGGEPLSGLTCSSVTRFIQLAPIRARDPGFKELVDREGQPIGQALRDTRRAMLLTAFEVTQPDAVLIEAFPFGRRSFRFELDALIAAAGSRHPRPSVLCSLRDIVVAPEDATRHREIVDRIRADFDFVLVHGDPTFISLEESFPLASEIADQLIYTGYVGDIDEADGGPDHAVDTDEVVVSAGGGAVGGALLSTALETRQRGCLAEARWHLLAGPNLPDAEFASLANRLPKGVFLERYRPDFPQMLRRCRVSVSQAGYNTVLDIIRARIPAVVIPFASGRETEQSLRAERLAARGVLELIRESELSPARLAHAIDRAIDRGPGAIAIDTAGVPRTAALIAGMIRSPAAAVRRKGGDLVLRPRGGMIPL
jgi:predicted glycosyltransferase